MGGMQKAKKLVLLSASDLRDPRGSTLRSIETNSSQARSLVHGDVTMRGGIRISRGRYFAAWRPARARSISKRSSHSSVVHQIGNLYAADPPLPASPLATKPSLHAGSARCAA